MGELAYERSGPERFLSVFPLLSQAIEREVKASDESAATKLGRLIAHVAILRQMSLSISGQIASGNLPALEAALVKDMGNTHEREVPEVLRSLENFAPAFHARICVASVQPKTLGLARRVWQRGNLAPKNRFGGPFGPKKSLGTDRRATRPSLIT